MHPVYVLEQDPPTRGVPAGVDADLTCFLVRGALSAEGASRVASQAEAAGFSPTGRDYPPGYRDNDRLLLDDPALAAGVFARLGSHLPATMRDAAGDTWALDGLNTRFRFCRYRGGQGFCVHRDGAHAEGPDRRSFLTCMVYLDDGRDFVGGATRFFSSRGKGARLLGAVIPERGTAIVFDHALWHDGAPVTSGTKRVMRTDVMYRRVTRAHAGVAHLGYVFCLLALRSGVLASGSRDRSIRLFVPDGDVELGRLRGHEGSITALAEDREGRLFSASRDRTVRVGGSRVVHRHEGAVLALAATDGGMVSGGADGRVVLWDADGHRPPRVIAERDAWAWSLLPHAGEVLCGWGDGVISCDGQAVPSEHLGAIHALAALADGRVAAAGADGAVGLFEHGNGTLRRVGGFAAHAGAVTTVVEVSPGVLASGGEDEVVRVWRLSDRTVLQTFQHDDFVRALAILPGGVLASASYDGTVRVTHLGATAPL